MVVEDLSLSTCDSSVSIDDMQQPIATYKMLPIAMASVLLGIGSTASESTSVKDFVAVTVPAFRCTA